MAKWIENPKQNVLSIRVTDEDKDLFDELKRRTHKSLSELILEAVYCYDNIIINRGK